MEAAELSWCSVVKPSYASCYFFLHLASVYNYDERKHVIGTKTVLATKVRPYLLTSRAILEPPCRRPTGQHYLTCITPKDPEAACLDSGSLCPHTPFSSTEPLLSLLVALVLFLFIQVSKSKNAFQVNSLADVMDTKGATVREAVTER